MGEVLALAIALAQHCLDNAHGLCALGPSACFWRVHSFPSAWLRALMRMIIARSHAQCRDWRQPRCARGEQLRWARPRQATALSAHAREPTQWPHACDRCRATHRALPACTPSNADYILRLQHTEPESLEIMLRLLILALPLVVALPAAFDEQELNAFQFEVQSRLQSKVRSPPESRPLVPR